MPLMLATVPQTLNCRGSVLGVLGRFGFKKNLDGIKAIRICWHSGEIPSLVLFEHDAAYELPLY